MHKSLFAAGFAAALVAFTQLASADRHHGGSDDRHDESENIQVGPVRSTSWTEWTTAH